MNISMTTNIVCLCVCVCDAFYTRPDDVNFALRAVARSPLSHDQQEEYLSTGQIGDVTAGFRRGATDGCSI